jgi:hypothetical protein
VSSLVLRSDYVAVRVTSQTNQIDDIGSLLCSVEWIATGIGSLLTNGSFHKSDLDRFRLEVEKLSQDSVGHLELYSVEEDIKIAVGYTNGQVIVTGYLTLPNILGRLDYSFESEPGYLARV